MMRQQRLRKHRVIQLQPQVGLLLGGELAKLKSRGVYLMRSHAMPYQRPQCHCLHDCLHDCHDAADYAAQSPKLNYHTRK